MIGAPASRREVDPTLEDTGTSVRNCLRLEDGSYCGDVGVIVLRGPAGAGKTTLADHLRDALGYPTAAVDTDVFNWQFVPGESNKRVAFENMLLIVENYLRHHYRVIVSGLILTGEEQGAMAQLRATAEDRGESYVDCYCAIPLGLAIERAERRDKVVPVDHVRAWWEWAENDIDNVAWPLHHLDMRRPIAHNVEAVLALLAD